MEEGQNFATLSTADVYVWIAVIVMAFFAGMFRVLRNGQWKGPRHAVGVVGCSAIVSLFMATVCHATFGFAAKNPMLLIALSGAVSLFGKEAHERFLITGIERLTTGRGTDGQVQK